MQHVKYARLYDISRSEAEKVKELCVQVLCNGDSLDIVKDLLELANQQCVQGFRTRDIVKESLRTVLDTYRCVCVCVLCSYFNGTVKLWNCVCKVAPNTS